MDLHKIRLKKALYFKCLFKVWRRTNTWMHGAGMFQNWRKWPKVILQQQVAFVWTVYFLRLSNNLYPISSQPQEEGMSLLWPSHPKIPQWRKGSQWYWSVWRTGIPAHTSRGTGKVSIGSQGSGVRGRWSCCLDRISEKVELNTLDWQIIRMVKV